MIIHALAIAIYAVLAHRVLLLGLPFFQEAATQRPALTIGCGAASDLVLAAAFVVCFAAVAAPRRKGRIPFALAWIFALATAAHVRYAEHFGMTFKPYHVGALETGEVWWTGLWMVLQSWRAWVVIVGAAVITFLPWPTIEVTKLRRLQVGGVAVLVAIAANAVNIGLRFKPGMHGELRYNVLWSVFHGYRDYQKVLATPMPTDTQLQMLRQYLGEGRQYAVGEVGTKFPLWQMGLPMGVQAANAGESQAVGSAFQRFLAERAAVHGPWNVVLLISESLRAKELSSFGGAAGRTPAIAALAAESVRFTETLSAGFRTHYGQTAAGCSLYGHGEFTILNKAPMSNAVCLSDVFAARGYENYFFYGASNHFDNQGIFYGYHRVKHVFGDEEFDPASVRGGWGVSDHALLTQALTRLEAAPKPFFATILTLSNHAPYRLPADAPPGVIDATADVRDQLIQYVDWSTGEFYRALKAKMPHTLFVMIADHAHFRDENLGAGQPAWELLRDVTRIPFLITAPGLPPEVAGKSFAHLTSNTDVPPTLLSLLGWSDVPNQFMGEDAFSRKGPVFVDFQNDLLELSGDPGAIRLRYVPDEMERILGAAGRFNMFAPPRETRDAAAVHP